jgi:hypothetical protein
MGVVLQINLEPRLHLHKHDAQAQRPTMQQRLNCLSKLGLRSVGAMEPIGLFALRDRALIKGPPPSGDRWMVGPPGLEPGTRRL